MRGERLCGYIISRSVGQPWGYMLCIEPVIRDISSALSTGENVSIQIPSIDILHEIQQNVSSGNPGSDMQDSRERSTYTRAASSNSVTTITSQSALSKIPTDRMDLNEELDEEQVVDSGRIAGHDLPQTSASGPGASSVSAMVSITVSYFYFAQCSNKIRLGTDTLLKSH